MATKKQTAEKASKSAKAAIDDPTDATRLEPGEAEAIAESKELSAGSGAIVESTAIDFSADVEAGMEGADKDSYAIPFLRVLQKISPQCDEADAAYVEGAKGGMFFNSVTNEVYDGAEGVTFLPCAFQRRFLQWAPRGSDQGYKGEHLPETIAEMRESGLIVDNEGSLLVAEVKDGPVSEKTSDKMVDTRSHFGLLVVDGAAYQVLFALSSTQIKKSKQLMSLLSSAKIEGPNGLVTPPTWMNQIKITTVIEKNDQGSWYGVKFEAAGVLKDGGLYTEAKKFHKAVGAGDAKANFAAEDGEAAPGEGKKF